MRNNCPKKTIISSKTNYTNSNCWSRRNDSKNICALLHVESATDEESDDDDDGDKSNSRFSKKSKKVCTNRNCQACSTKKSRCGSAKPCGSEKVFRKCLLSDSKKYEPCKKAGKETHKRFKESPRSYNQTHKSCKESPRSYNQTHKTCKESPRSYNQAHKTCKDSPRSCKQTQMNCNGTPRTVFESSSEVGSTRNCIETPRSEEFQCQDEASEEYSQSKSTTEKSCNVDVGTRKSCREVGTNCHETAGCYKVTSRERQLAEKCSSVKNRWQPTQKEHAISKTYCFPESEDSDGDQTPRRTMLFSKTERQHKFCRSGCTSCYCNEAPIRPLLKCDNDGDHCDCRKDTTAKTRPSLACENSDVHSVFLKYAPESRRAVFDQYTNRRRNYENYSSGYFLDLKKQLAKLEVEMREDVPGEEHAKCNDEGYKGGDVKNRKSSKGIKCPEASVDSLIKELLDFRDQNYFECHGETEQPKLETKPHACQHDFTINEKFQPVPKNPDAYGMSRCRICSKPSYESLANFTNCTSVSSSSLLRFPSRACQQGQISVDREEDAVSCKSSEKCLRNLVYTLGDECYNIEVSQDFYKDLESSLKLPAYKRPLPVNSMALRYQKGVS